MFIAPIVEGHGEYEAVPSLLHRIAEKCGSSTPLKINPPIRVKSGSFFHDEAYFNKYIAMASAKAAQERGAVLILMDCEDDCPAELGPKILEKAKGQRSDIHFIVALAYREFETWFIAAAESFKGSYGFPADLSAPSNFESFRDAKGWLSSRMSVNYDPVIHQVKFTRLLDIDLAKNSHSFNRLYSKISSALST
jgi:hypothetical protein